MTTVRRGTKVPARWRLFVCGLALLAGGLVAASAGGWMPHTSPQTSAALTPADPDAALPVPTRRSSSGVSSTKFPGSDQSFRKELEASIPAELSDVLAFYRAELTKRGWQEKTDGATVTAERAELAFTSPEGPAMLKLGRAREETTVSLVQRNPQAAAKADIMPKAGQARLMLGRRRPR